MRAGRRPLRGRTLIQARRSLSAIEQSLAPELGSAIALATVMADLARTDTEFAALLGAVDGTHVGGDVRMLVVRCGLDRATHGR